MATFLTVLARARFRTQSKVHGGTWWNNLLVVALDGFFFIWKTEKVTGRVRQVVVL